MKVYLAGPDVFYPDNKAIEKKTKLEEKNFSPLYPLDNENEIDNFANDRETARKIAAANEKMIEDCDIVLANMRPWYGPSMDVGTVYEIGYARKANKIIVGYYEKPVELFADRVKQSSVHKEGMAVEDFKMEDNLMIVSAIESSKGFIFQSFDEAIEYIEILRQQFDEQTRGDSALVSSQGIFHQSIDRDVTAVAEVPTDAARLLGYNQDTCMRLHP